MRAIASIEAFTDPEAMATVLRLGLPVFSSGELAIQGVRIKKSRRNASFGRNPVLVGVHLEVAVEETASGHHDTLGFYVKVYRPGHAEIAYASHYARELVKPAFGEALSLIRDRDMLIWALPNDPAMSQLPTLMNRDEVHAKLPWFRLGVSKSDYQVKSVTLLHYEPEVRATLSILLVHRASKNELVVFAKTFAADLAAAINSRFRVLWRLSKRHQEAPLVARPLGHGSGLRVFWQAQAVGRPLLDAPMAPGLASCLSRVACALSHLHDAPLQPSTDVASRTVDHWITEARRRLVKISRFDAGLHHRLVLIIEQIEQRAGQLVCRPLSMIHGDFHPGQVWMQNDRVVLFDLDEISWGDPMEDVATFACKLEMAAIEPSAVRLFIDGYRDASPARFDPMALSWHMAVQGLVQACRAFVFQQPGWENDLYKRLATAEGYSARLVGDHSQ